MLKNTKRLLSLVLCIVMTLSLLPAAVLATEADFTLTVVPSITEAEVGDTVTFQVFGQGRDITALQFRLNYPEGMTYVANSASVPSGLRDSIGWAATDWTESSVTWTGYNADPADFPEGTLLLTFDCIMDEPGEYQVDFDDYYAFDADFDETTSALDSEAVIVGPLVPGTEPVTAPSIVSSLTVSAGPAVETAVVGDIVTFNVYVRGESFCGLSFDLEIPEGLRFVPGSGSTPPLSNGNVGYWWSEDTMNFAMSYTSPLTFSEDSWMLSFSCVAEIPGTYSIGLKNLTAYDNWSDDLVPNLVVQTLCVSEASSFCAIEILPEQDSVTLGDTVSVEICASGNGLTALQFNLDVPAGLTYVPGSATVPDSLKSDLGIAGGIDWTEESLLWTMYNDVPITIPRGTLLMSFQCTADAPGSYTIGLKELYPFDGKFEEFEAQYTCDTVTVTECAHSYTSETTSEATCTAPGEITHRCTLCGNSYTEFLPALGHSFIKGTCTLCGEDDPNYSGSFFTATVVASPSPAVIGEAVEFTVYGHGEAICALEFQLIIPEGMTYVPNSAAVPSDLRALLGWAATDWTESSMMWTGYNDIVTDIPEDTVLLTFSCIPDLVGRYRVELRDLLAFDRSYEEIASTCTVDYLAVYDCAQLGHSWTDATCDTPKTCSRCGTTEGSALGHEFGSAVVTVQPTCTGDGLQVQTCIRCPETKSETVPMTGHSHEALVTAPTCTQEGYTTYTCHCGDTYTGNQTAALGHSWIDATCTTPKTCDRCGTTEGSALGHEFGNAVVAVQPTCTQDGLQVKTCIRCPETKSETVPMTGHSHEALVTAPTCTQEGYTTYTCHCGDTYTGNRIPATGHSHQAAVTAPTCTLGGYTTYTCHCGDSYVANYTAPLGHNERLTTVNPTCTLDGSKTYTCTVCGNVRSEVIPATGHSYEATVIAPTCTVSGYTYHECGSCGNNYVDTYVPATGHRYQAVVTPPTATEQGYTTYTCSLCSSSYITDYTAPLGLTLTGSFVSGGEGKLTFELLQDGQVVHSITVDGKTGSYSIPFILPGDYTLKISKGTHTFREYPVTVDANPTTLDVQLCLIGDVTCDGRVNVGDVSRLYAHARKTNLLSGYPLQIGELTGEGRVNVGDVSRLYAHAKKTNPLW